MMPMSVDNVSQFHCHFIYEVEGFFRFRAFVEARVNDDRLCVFLGSRERNSLFIANANICTFMFLTVQCFQLTNCLVVSLSASQAKSDKLSGTLRVLGEVFQLLIVWLMELCEFWSCRFLLFPSSRMENLLNIDLNTIKRTT
jgi:hypothetical protein